MSERKKRKVYSPEFKAKVGLEALKGVRTIVSAHESISINSGNNPSILSLVPNAGESHAQQSRIRSPGQPLAGTH